MIFIKNHDEYDECIERIEGYINMRSRDGYLHVAEEFELNGLIEAISFYEDTNGIKSYWNKNL